jgi:hypothetical protein
MMESNMSHETHWEFITSLCLVMFATLPTLSGTDDSSSDWAIDVRTGDTQPSGVPILLTLTVRNVGDKPIYYGPGVRYPPARYFRASITDTKEKTIERQLNNDEDGAISGPGGWINPGRSVDVPAAIASLPPGAYRIQVGNGKTAQFKVMDDARLTTKWERDLLSTIHRDDAFGIYVATTYLSAEQPSKALMDALLKDILSNDSELAYRAARPLATVRQLPASTTPLISAAMEKHIALAKRSGHSNPLVLASLAGLASSIGTDEALESVLTLAHTSEVRGNAIWALGSFRQEKANKELRAFLEDQDETLRFRAAQRLSDHKDPAALEELLRVAENPKSQWRMYAFDALLNYPSDFRVESAIKTGLDDPDSQVRQSAGLALRRLTKDRESSR